MPLSLLPGSFSPAGSRATVLIPLVESFVSAGFPSPADDYTHRRIDLNEFLVKKPAATFFIWASGVSMDGEKKSTIADGDLLVVDRSREPVDGSIVVACVNMQPTLKRFRRHNQRVWLEPENEQFPIIEISAEDELVIEGVVSARITMF